MREVLEAAGYKGNEAALVARHMHLSGGLNEPFMSAMLTHIAAEPETKSKFIEAVNAARKNDGSKDFDAEIFFEQIKNLPKADMWAYAIGATQRFFQKEVVVRLQEPTDYTKKHGEEIIEISRQMGELEEQRITDPCHIGVCIGGLAGTANDYMKRQKGMLRNSPGKSPQHLFILAGGRKLTGEPGKGDNIVQSTETFFYDSDKPYLDYLFDYTKQYKPELKGKTELTEGDMMYERFSTIFGADKARIGYSFIAAANVEEFAGKIAEKLKKTSGKERKIAAFTTYNIFARTYNAMLETALEQHEVNDVVVKSDAVSGSYSPQTLIREIAKTLNGQYRRVAQALDFEPHDQRELSGQKIASLETLANEAFWLREREASRIPSPDILSKEGGERQPAMAALQPGKGAAVAGQPVKN